MMKKFANIITIALVGILLPMFVFAAQDITIENLGQELSTTPGQYTQNLKLFLTQTSTVAQIVSLQVSQTGVPDRQPQTITVPASGSAAFPSIEGLTVGDYKVGAYMAGALISNELAFTISANASSTGGSGPTYAVGIFQAEFPPKDQVITGTNATIKGVVKVTAPVVTSTPIRLSFFSGVTGSPLGNEQVLFEENMSFGQQRPITLSFTGLTPGQSYSFLFKNGGSMSQQLSFTTPNGTTTPNAVFAGQTIGTSESTGVFTEIPDTISDKGIVPRCGVTEGTDAEKRMCGYKDFLQLVWNFIQYVLIILGPIVAIIAMYAGAMMIWFGKKADKTARDMEMLKNARALLERVAIGLIIMLCAWIIPTTIIRELGVKPEYVLLDIFDGQ